MSTLLRRAVLVAVLAGAAPAAAAAPEAWTTYRSPRFGWELSYPPELTLVAYFDGASADLRDARTGAPVAQLEVWPPDLCPRERPGTTAEGLGRERIATVTQADGDDGSSSCGAPMTLRRLASRHGVAYWEATLTCRDERVAHGRTTRRVVGTKGPTFFADVSQPWRTRVLTVDPVGVDPRMTGTDSAADPVPVRRVLETLAVRSLPREDVRCIDDGAGAPAATGTRVRPGD